MPVRRALPQGITSLRPGAVRHRPQKGHSQLHPGVAPVSSFSHRTQRFQPLPAPLGEPPYSYDLEVSFPDIAATAQQNGQVVFHTVGDTGGVKDASYQAGVATAMKGDLNLPAKKVPNFFYHLGDVVYYNGQIVDYYDQFYEPYDHYGPPIFAIPGNHDGDPIDPTQVSLDGWVAYFMTARPHVNPESKDAPRVTLSQPNCYFTLHCPYVTIVGMYTNVPEGGSIDSIQQQWLTNEFATAPEDKALILALHHPIYSFDDHHSGSANMADAVQHAINDSRRVPNMVLMAHVHNYQRIEKTIAGRTATPFLVAGHGGYFHLHHLNSAVGTKDANTGAKLVFGDDKHHGYVTLTVDGENISGSMTSAAPDGTASHDVDTFNYPAAVQKLANGATATL